MILTQENYFSREADIEFLSNSQYHNFCGSIGIKACEGRALAKIKGEWEDETTLPMMVGSYVDSHFEGTLDVFKAKNPVFTTKGELKSQFQKAEEVIKRIERDDFFMKFLSGEKQRIFTGEIGGAKWKGKIDSLVMGRCIVDLKVMKSLRDRFWAGDYGRVSFIEFWGQYDQGAIYQEIVRQNTGQKLPFFIVGASKEPEVDIEIIGIDNNTLENALMDIESNVDRIIKLKAGVIEPKSCGVCDYCKSVKVLSEPIHYLDLTGKIE